MGGLTSKAKTPSVVYVPVETEVVDDALQNNEKEAETDIDTSEKATEITEKERAQSVAKARRGRSGTVQTSTRGVFTLNDLIPQRKSLLGE